MGLSLFKSCSAYPEPKARIGVGVIAPAPNPDPARWTLLSCLPFDHAHVLIVRYLDCTNFEGVKVMVFRGKYKRRRNLDPHFSEGADSPLARFRPDETGIEMAKAFAKSVSP